MWFLLVQELLETFRPVAALYIFLTKMTYADWVNENLREMKYIEE
jgi:hypothetical protein